jgi:DNA-binding CsgD family transcriptional regulator
MLEQLINQQSLYVWAKDINYRYIYVNENYAAAAGVESPRQMIGKTDDEMPWKHLAGEFQRGDYCVIKMGNRLHSLEKSDTVNGITDIIVSETQFIDKRGRVIGVMGSFVDVTGKKVIETPGYYDKSTQRYYLGVAALGNIYFTLLQFEVFKRIIEGKTAAQIAVVMGVTAKTIESHISYIKNKFGVATKSELVEI